MFISFPKRHRLGGPHIFSEGFGEEKIGYPWQESSLQIIQYIIS
jgi:hypothetical protein